MSDELSERARSVVNSGETPKQAVARLSLMYMMTNDPGLRDEIDTDLASFPNAMFKGLDIGLVNASTEEGSE